MAHELEILARAIRAARDAAADVAERKDDLPCFIVRTVKPERVAAEIQLLEAYVTRGPWENKSKIAKLTYDITLRAGHMRRFLDACGCGLRGFSTRDDDD